MRSVSRGTLIATLTLVASVAAVIAIAVGVDLLTVGAHGGVMLAGLMMVPEAKSIEKLQAQSTASVPGQLEAINWQFFDVQTYVDNTTTVLPFLTAVQADKTLGNMEAAGQIPAPNFFEIVAFTIDYLVQPSNSAAVLTGVVDDIALLQNTGRGLFTFTLNQKPYVSAPIASIGGSGGQMSIIFGTTAANAVEQFGQGIPNNAWYVSKGITIPPNNQISAQIQWSAAQNLTANVNIRLSMWGVYHRKVV